MSTLSVITANYLFINLLLKFIFTITIFLISTGAIIQLGAKQLNAQVIISFVFILRWCWSENNITLCALTFIVLFIYICITFRKKAILMVRWFAFSTIASLLVIKVFIWFLGLFNEIWVLMGQSLIMCTSYFIWDNIMVREPVILQSSNFIDNSLVLESNSFDSFEDDSKEITEQTALLPENKNSSNLNIFQRFWKSQQTKNRRRARRHALNREAPLLEYCVNLVRNPSQQNPSNRSSRRRNRGTNSRRRNN